ncbi:hypothetical protein L7F22_011162 [Adiantum nelumboides]|nr:hypothetical protein [Adiantum nelumboides]
MSNPPGSAGSAGAAAPRGRSSSHWTCSPSAAATSNRATRSGVSSPAGAAPVPGRHRVRNGIRTGLQLRGERGAQPVVAPGEPVVGGVARVGRLGRGDRVQPDQTGLGPVVAHGLQQRLGAGPGLGARGGGALVAGLQHRDQQRLLGPEVVEQGRLADPDPARDLLRRRRVEPAGREHLQRRVQDLLPPLPPLGVAPACRRHRPRLAHQSRVLLGPAADRGRLLVHPGRARDRAAPDGAVGRPVRVRGESFDERSPSLSLPSSTALGATWDPELARRYGSALGAEARRQHADVVLGPTINLHRTPFGGRHFEALSEDPLLTGELAAAYVEGLQAHGVAATPKHYVANDAESERFTVDDAVGERALHELYLAAFEPAVTRAGAWALMSAYNSVNGATMSENPLLAEPLTGEWGFDGLVMSDWGAVRTTVASARAEQHLVMPGPVGAWGERLVTAVRDGEVEEAVVDGKLRRLLRLAARRPAPQHRRAAVGRLVARHGRGARAQRRARPHPGRRERHGPARRGRRAAGRAARRARRGPGALPAGRAGRRGRAALRPGHGHRPGHRGTRTARGVPRRGRLRAAQRAPARRLADLDGRRDPRRRRDRRGVGAVGTRARDAPGRGRRRRARDGARADGTAVLDTEAVLTGDEGPGAAIFEAPSVTGEVGTDGPVDLVFRFRPSGGEAGMALFALTVGTETRPDRERGLRPHLAGPARPPGRPGPGRRRGQPAHRGGGQLRRPGAAALARRGGRGAARLVRRGALRRRRRRRAARARRAGRAAADHLARHGGERSVLSGRPTGGVLRYDEGVHVGHRNWLRHGETPAYPFGHGLGYTTWTLDDAVAGPWSADGVAVTVTLTNTGDRAGRQVVQAYLSRPGSDVERPARAGRLGGRRRRPRHDDGHRGGVAARVPPPCGRDVGDRAGDLRPAPRVLRGRHPAARHGGGRRRGLSERQGRPVGDAQVLHPADAQLRVQDGRRVVVGAHLGRAGRVVDGVVGLHQVVGQVVVGDGVRTRGQLGGDPLLERGLFGDPPGQPDARGHHPHVVALGVGEVPRVDPGPVTEVAGAQPHRAPGAATGDVRRQAEPVVGGRVAPAHRVQVERHRAVVHHQVRPVQGRVGAVEQPDLPPLVDSVTIGFAASHMTRPSTWSSRFEPTPGRSERTSMPNSRRCYPGPMPESISSFGVSIAPAARITSRSAVTVSRPGPIPRWYSTPVALVPSNSTWEAQQSVRTSRFGREPRTGAVRHRGRRAGAVGEGVDLEVPGAVGDGRALVEPHGRHADLRGGGQHGVAAGILRGDLHEVDRAGAAVAVPVAVVWSPGAGSVASTRRRTSRSGRTRPTRRGPRAGSRRRCRSCASRSRRGPSRGRGACGSCRAPAARPVVPVVAGVEQRHPVGEPQDVGVADVGRARLQQQHPHGGILGEPRRERTARRAAPHHDVVEPVGHAVSPMPCSISFARCSGRQPSPWRPRSRNHVSPASATTPMNRNAMNRSHPCLPAQPPDQHRHRDQQVRDVDHDDRHAGDRGEHLGHADVRDQDQDRDDTDDDRRHHRRLVLRVDARQHRARRERVVPGHREHQPDRGGVHREQADDDGDADGDQEDAADRAAGDLQQHELTTAVLAAQARVGQVGGGQDDAEQDQPAEHERGDHRAQDRRRRRAARVHRLLPERAGGVEAVHDHRDGVADAQQQRHDDDHRGDQLDEHAGGVDPGHQLDADRVDDRGEHDEDRPEQHAVDRGVAGVGGVADQLEARPDLRERQLRGQRDRGQRDHRGGEHHPAGHPRHRRPGQALGPVVDRPARPGPPVGRAAGAEAEVEQLERAGQDRDVADPGREAGELADAAVEGLAVAELGEPSPVAVASGDGSRRVGSGTVIVDLLGRCVASSWRPQRPENHPWGCGAVFVQTCLISWYSASPVGPSSRPLPERPMPPHSAPGTYGWKSLIQTVPWRSADATRWARPMSAVNTAPASPYSVSLPRRTASSSVWNRSTVSSGPKVSSRISRDPGARSVMTVGRLEVAVRQVGVVRAGAAAADRGALGTSGRDEVLDLGQVRGGDQRADLDAVGETVAEPDQLRAAHHLVDDGVGDRVLDDQPRAGRADLAGVQEHREHHVVDGELEVGVGEDDVRVLPAQLDGGALHRLGRRRMIFWPVDRPPVKLTMSTSGCSVSGAPTDGPSPSTMFTTPAGTPTSSHSSTSTIEVSGVTSLGLITMVLPAAIAGATFQDSCSSG